MSEKLTMRQVRMMRGLSMIQASRMMGVHSNTLQNWELGKSKIPDVVKRGIALIYNIEVEQINWED
jgi:DNA-binding transcriptional regulator YiaG